MEDMFHQMNSSTCLNSDYKQEWWKTMVRVGDDEEELTDGLRKGAWTEEEDSKLASAVGIHGGGRWNTLASLAGLKRSGKSCRLRWLNYLRPGLRHGTFTLEEQLRILELHFQWGNRWSKIAESLPGRTDNEIKNYWRTKVQKLARQFHCQADSPEFRDALRNIWIPRLTEQIHAGSTQTTNNEKAQSESPFQHCGPELTGSSSSSSNNSSEACSLIDAQSSWAQNSLDQYIVGPMWSQPLDFTDSFPAQHQSPESCLSADLGPNWEQMNSYLWDMTLNDGDDMLFLQQQQLDYLAQMAI